MCVVGIKEKTERERLMPTPTREEKELLLRGQDGCVDKRGVGLYRCMRQARCPTHKQSLLVVCACTIDVLYGRSMYYTLHLQCTIG